MAAFQAGSGGISGRRCCIVTIVRRNKKGYSLKAPDLNTKPAPRCLHISFLDIIVKFVNHITLPPMQKLRSPGASFLAVFSGKGPGTHKMHGRPRLICGMMDAGSTRKRKEADRQPGSPCLCLLSVNRISYKNQGEKDALFYCFCPFGGRHGSVPAGTHGSELDHYRLILHIRGETDYEKRSDPEAHTGSHLAGCFSVWRSQSVLVRLQISALPEDGSEYAV